MSTPGDRRYAEEHEWAKQESEGVRVGITDYAQQELGEVVYADLPEVGSEVVRGESFGTVESTKAVSEIYAPIDGKVKAVNEALTDSPETINSSPYEDGWLILVEPADVGQVQALMDAAKYDSFVAEIAG